MTQSFRFPSVRSADRVLILGLGETGVAAARWCAARGATLRVVDTRRAPAGLAALNQHGIRAELYLGPDGMTGAALRGVHRVVLSPGLNPHQEPVAGFLAQARAAGAEVVGEIELFARALQDLRPQGYAPRVLGVTGTNGKTTVTSLTRHLVQAGGHTVRAAGNIGPAALTSLLEALAQDALPDAWVLELSSFQLEATRSLDLVAGAVLNLTQDHLDWHGSMEAYGAAKARLLGMAQCAIVNRDDARVCTMVADLAGPAVCSFGAQPPALAGDLGLVTQPGGRWLAVAEGRGKSVALQAADRRAPGIVRPLMPTEALQIHGQHNALNALAALALARSLRLDWAPLLQALRSYRGEPHRTEFIRSVAGVDFIDDSKGTNVGATLAALQGLGRRVVLIAGGLGKGQDFSPLIPAVRDHARAVLLIGQDGPLLAQALAPCGVPLIACDTLEQAVARGLERAQPGDAVLLSPACASMDMFRNYVHRSACFVDAVRELALDRGEVA